MKIGIYQEVFSVIFDAISRCKSSETFRARCAFAYSYLQTHDFSAMPEGKYEVNDFMFFMIQRYETKPRAEAKFEAHRRYADIQYLFSGHEVIGFCGVEQVAPLEPFSEEKDIGKYADPEFYNEVILHPGEFALFEPRDCHKPSFCPDGEAPCPVEKVVVKILAD